MASKKDVYILGLTYFGNHDASAALLKNGKLVASAEEERFTRVKFDRSFPKNSIDWCLESAGIKSKDISHVGYFWQPWVGVPNRIIYSVRGLPKSVTKGTSNFNILLDFLRAKYYFEKKYKFDGKFHFLNHHLTHAASSFYSSGFSKAAILSADGTGEKTTTWTGIGDGNSLTPIQTIDWPNSLGHLYATVTQYLGFTIFSDEYKVMGLSPYGKPTYISEFRKIIKTRGDGSFFVDNSYLGFPFSHSQMYSEKWVKRLGKPRVADELISKRHKDIASSMQLRLEEVLEEIVINLKEKSSQDKLCMSGGVSLNSVALGKLSEKKIFDEIYTSPVSGDSGCALGAAYFISHVLLGEKKNYPLSHAYWGSKFNKVEIKKTLSKNKLKFTIVKNPEKKVANLISKGHVIGWFNGNSEIGQRALGNRSILADPRDPKMKDRVNSLIKYRESFRPFAPAIAWEHQSKYFDWGNPVPYMTEVHPIKKEKRKEIPSVTHVDGTGRLQTVFKKTNPSFWKIINEFYKITNVPVVLNTSFNVKGEPIVDSPQDAINTFLKSGIDDLFLGSYWVTKK